MFLACVIALVFKTLDDDDDDEDEEKKTTAMENTKMAADEDPYRLDPVLHLGELTILKWTIPRLHDFCNLLCCFPDRIKSSLVEMPPVGADLEAVRIKRDKERRARALIKEVALYTCFLVLISCIAWGSNDLNVYRMNSALYTMFDGSSVSLKLRDVLFKSIS